MDTFWIWLIVIVVACILAFRKSLVALFRNLPPTPTAPPVPEPTPPEPDLGTCRFASTRREAEDLAKHGAFTILAPDGHYKWAFFTCPCGCGELIALNLMKSAYPSWKVELSQKGLYTVSPSVDSQTCGAHFWIKNGQVIWC